MASDQILTVMIQQVDDEGSISDEENAATVSMNRIVSMKNNAKNWATGKVPDGCLGT